jgi:hypothetical protein
MLKTFIGVFLLGVMLSFSENLYGYALIPLTICGVMLALGLALERKG